MPNGGLHHCSGYCRHYNNETDFCELRKIEVSKPRWTTCNNFNRATEEVRGPVYAIIGEVRNGAIRYLELPYLDGKRVDSEQASGGGDTVMRVENSDGGIVEFGSSEEYLDYFETH